MSHDVEHLLREALTARTAHVQGRPSSLNELRAAVRAPRRRVAPAAAALAVAASVVGLALGATVLGDTLSRTSGDLAAPRLSAAPFPADRHYLATAEGNIVIVRAADGAVVGQLPPDRAGDPLQAPVLALDGSRVYAVWEKTRKLGYFDLRSEELVVLDSRDSGLYGVTVSADGSTIAYQHSPVIGQREPGTVIVRNVSSGRVVELEAAPGGPQVLGLALSPDGSTLAVVPTDVQVRPLLLVDATDPQGFSSARTVNGAECGNGRADQPRWTSRGLYVYRACVDGNGMTSSSAVLKVNAETGTSTLLQELPTSSTLLYTVVDSPAATVLIAADFTYGPKPGSVTSQTLPDGSPEAVPEVDGLAVTSAQ